MMVNVVVFVCLTKRSLCKGECGWFNVGRAETPYVVGSDKFGCGR